MKPILIALLFVVLLILPTAASAGSRPGRCYTDIYRGRAWLICPCKNVTYACEDYYRIPVYHGRISVR